MEVDSDDDAWRLNLNDAWTSDSEGEARAKPSARATKVARAELDAVNVDVDAAPAPTTSTRGDYALTLPNALGVLTVAQIHECELGTVVWNAALILCDWLRANAGTLRGRAILEVGAGCGACGFYAAACGADCVIADCGPQTMRNLEKTLACYENLSRDATRWWIVCGKRQTSATLVGGGLRNPRGCDDSERFLGASGIGRTWEFSRTRALASRRRWRRRTSSTSSSAPTCCTFQARKRACSRHFVCV